MPASITLDSLSYRTPDGRELFDKLTLAFGGERTGLVGRNGVGKTTLLRLILGELAPTSGTIARVGRVGVLRQALKPPAGASVAGLLGVAEELARQKRILCGQGSEADLADADWTLEARLEEALQVTGLGGLDLDRSAATLSGGQATRLALAGLLVDRPDILVLDEPTNNLDADAREALVAMMGGWRGGAIVVSHDRTLLRAMDRIVELTNLGARAYGGNYDLFLERKALESEAAAHGLADAQRAAVRVARQAQVARERKARRDAAGRRFAARGSEPKILLGAQAERAENTAAREGRLAQRQREAAQARLEEAKAQVERLRDLAFDLPPSGLTVDRTVLSFDEVAFAYPGEAELFRNITFRIVGPQRLAVSGPNGSGKTTLLRLAVGELRPSRGRVQLSAPTALMDQHTDMLAQEETLVEAFRRLNPRSSENAARAALARFLFRNVAADKQVGVLSGGERLRAALACALMADRPPQLLILDEPTNHLDLDSITAVGAALRDYDGALLLVSHDRDFLDAVGIEREVALI